MNAYAFPRDLIEEIKARWHTVPDEQFQLPEDSVLQRFLETCYHASLRTSEQRSVHCVVAYASLANIPEGALLLTNGPIVLTESELVRLSPVTQRRQTVIGCDVLDNWLGIWGFFEYGHAWVQHSAGDPPAAPIQSADFPPDCLTITIEGPGALTVSRGRTSLVRLRDGRILLPQENPLQSLQNPLGRFFHQLVDDLQQPALSSIALSPAGESLARRSLLDVYTTSLLAILERIRLSQHGGCLVITRTQIDMPLAHITYPVSDHVGLADEIVKYKALEDSLSGPPAASRLASELEQCRAELELHRVSRQLIRGINQINLLAAVDGAVLLDAHLRIQGFGVRFPVVLLPGITVIDALTGNEYSCDIWGLRHQSVFSICQKCDQAIGLIVSQDGESKAVLAVDGKLHFWGGILD